MNRQLDFSPRDRHLSLIEAHFGGRVRETLSEFPASPDIRPTQALPIIRRITGEQKPAAVIARWGFVSSWGSARKPSPVFNTCCEEAASAARWRHAWQYARCLIPATAWYERTTAVEIGGGEHVPDAFVRTPKLVKQQSLFQVALRRTGGGLIMFAGLHGFSPTLAGNRETVSILTDAGPSALEWALDRIPVALKSEAWDRWLDPDLTDPHEIRLVLNRVDPEFQIFKVHAF